MQLIALNLNIAFSGVIQKVACAAEWEVTCLYLQDCFNSFNSPYFWWLFCECDAQHICSTQPVTFSRNEAVLARLFVLANFSSSSFTLLTVGLCIVYFLQCRSDTLAGNYYDSLWDPVFYVLLYFTTRLNLSLKPVMASFTAKSQDCRLYSFYLFVMS